MSEPQSAEIDPARELLRRVLDEKRIRHDHGYPVEVGPHHCAGCDLIEAIRECVNPPGVRP